MTDSTVFGLPYENMFAAGPGTEVRRCPVAPAHSPPVSAASVIALEYNTTVSASGRRVAACHALWLGRPCENCGCQQTPSPTDDNAFTFHIPFSYLPLALYRLLRATPASQLSACGSYRTYRTYCMYDEHLGLQCLFLLIQCGFRRSRVSCRITVHHLRLETLVRDSHARTAHPLVKY